MMSAVHTEVESASGAWWSSAANAATVVPALVDVVGDGLALLDHQGCFLGLNPPAVEVLGRLAPFAISSDPPPAPGSRTTTWTGSGGRRRDLEYRVAPVPGIGHAVWFSDVTNVRRQQERLRAIVRAAARSDVG